MSEIIKWLELIPRYPRDLWPAVFRQVEEQVLVGVHGDMFGLQAALRLACRGLCRSRHFPAHAELPPRLIMEFADRPRAVMRSRPKPFVSVLQYTVLCERLEAAVRNEAERFIKLTPEHKVAFPNAETAEALRVGLRCPGCAGSARPGYTGSKPSGSHFCEACFADLPKETRQCIKAGFADFSDLERARRVLRYRQQWAEIELAYADPDDPLRRGPYARPVYCIELDRVFRSARRAAKVLNGSRPDTKPITRADIRTAIKRRSGCAGYHWRYDSELPATLVSTGRERPVRCVKVIYNHGGDGAVPELPFNSRSEAARFVGVSQATLAAALEAEGSDRGVVRGPRGLFTFETLDVEPEEADEPIVPQPEGPTLFDLIRSAT